ncbi:MAG: hypothetical protein BWK77_04970 [Verrucomicrobia bacterium A1]|nr:MAG: hypothetical protein BWK77_04970 [Verrucomicrobia bacterium A1]
MTWYLKKISGEVFGPVELATLETWATDGRVAPDDQLSEDQVHWVPAPERAELAMDWVVELDDGGTYGPLHLFSLRDLLEDGSISRRLKITNRRTRETSTVSDALVPVLMARDVKLQSTIESLTERLEEAEKKHKKAHSKKGAGDSEVTSREKQLRHEVEVLTEMKNDFKHKMEKWEALYATEETNARKHEQQLLKEIQALKAAANSGAPVPATAPAADDERWKGELEQERKTAAEREKKLQAEIASLKGASKEPGDLQQQVEKWKKLYENARDTAKAEKSRAQEAQVKTAPATGDLVPRAMLDEAQRKLAQVERSYQNLMRTLNRGLSPSPRGHPTGTADNLRRRDVS